jgi:hypothetical protein
MTNALRALTLATALAAMVGTTAAAQTGTTTSRSKTAGIGVGIFASGASIDSDASDERETGMGMGLHMGYGISETVSLFGRASWFTAETSDPEWQAQDYSVDEFGVGIRASWGTQAYAVRPYAQLMLAKRDFEIELGDIGNLGTVEGDGTAYSAGAGVEWFVTPTLAVDAGLSLSTGSLVARGGRGGYSVSYEIEATIIRLDVGVTLHP